MTTQVKERKQVLKQDERAHLAQAKADKLQRKSLDSGKTKKAEKAQDKADKEVGKTLSNSDTSDDDL
jgi:hypothetical protein